MPDMPWQSHPRSSRPTSVWRQLSPLLFPKIVSIALRMVQVNILDTATIMLGLPRLDATLASLSFDI